MLKLAIFLLGLLCLRANADLEYWDHDREDPGAIYKISLIDGLPSLMDTNVFARDVNNGSSSNNQNGPTGSICPQDDGKTYYAPDGHPYKIKCGYYETKNQTTIESCHQPSVVACAYRCATYNAEGNHTVKCTGANYYPAGTKDDPPLDCFLRAYVSHKHFHNHRDMKSAILYKYSIS